MAQKEIILEGLRFKKELVIQLISLSTAILALSISFLDKLTRDISNKRTLVYLRISWCGYFLCIIFGIWTLMAITGTLLTGCLESKSNITIPQSLDIIAFVLSTIFMILFGMNALNTIFEKNLLKKEVKQSKSRKLKQE